MTRSFETNLNINAGLTMANSAGNPGQILVSSGNSATPTWQDLSINNSPYGLVPIVPTTVTGTGVTIGSDGTVNISAASTASLNGVFSATYDNYYVIYDLVFSSAVAMNIRMRKAGADESSGTAGTSGLYDRGSVWNSSSTPSASHSVQQTSWTMGSKTVYRGQLTFEAPFLTKTTVMSQVGMEYEPATPLMLAVTGQHAHRSSLAYDGFTFYPTSGTMTGTIKVYGYSKSSSFLPTSGVVPSNYVSIGYLSADQTITSGADVSPTFIASADPQNWWNATTKRFTPTIGGYYNIEYFAHWKTGVTSNNQTNIQIQKNGGTVAMFQDPINLSTGTAHSVGGSKLVYLNGSTDYINFTAYTSNTTSQVLTGTTDGAWTYFSAALVTTEINAPGQNYILNGAFDISQRPGSIATTASSTSNTNTYTLDQWVIQAPGVVTPGILTVTGAQATTTVASISGYEYPNYMTWVTATNVSGTVVGTSNLSQRIDDVRTLAGKTVTLSFWAKGSSANSNFTPIIEQNFGTGGSASVTNTGTAISLTTSWQRFSYTVTLGSMSGKTIGTNSYLDVRPFQWSSASWLSGFTVSIAGVKLEEGTVPTNFVRKNPSLASELAECQKYYYRISGSGTTSPVPVSSATYYNATTAYGPFKFPVTMRSAPSASVNSATAVTVYAGNSGLASSLIYFGNNVVSKDQIEIRYTTAASTLGYGAFVRFPASSTDYMEFTAEI